MNPELKALRPGMPEEDYVDPRLTGIGKPPAKYTVAVHERIVAELKNGQRPQGACARAGITYATFQAWLQRGKEGDPHLAQFYEDVEIAFNLAEARAVDTVTKPTEEMSPEDAKWWLERSRPAGYSKQVKTTVEGQQKEMLARLEAYWVGRPARLLTGEQIFIETLAVCAGQDTTHVSELQAVEIKQLPAHGEPQESSEEQC